MVRTPLTRRAPLRAVTPIRRVSPKRAALIAANGVPPRLTAPKRPASTGPARDVVALVLARDGYACVRCGDPIHGVRGAHWSLQHRVARGQGGTSLAARNLPSNLITLCGDGTSGCHGQVEQRRSEDRTAGYWLRRDTGGRPTDTATVPLFSARYGWVLLDDAGGFSPALAVAA